MPKYAANLSMMYTEVEFLDRFRAAAADGFRGVEFLFPYEYDKRELKHRLDAHGLTQALFNAPPGDWSIGERGTSSLPGREDAFKRGFEQALEYAAVLGNDRVHVMAGLIRPEQSREVHRSVYLENLNWAAHQAKSAGITVVIEPINTRDIPGFFLNRQDDAHAICAAVGASNLKVQMDLYHCQIVEGDVAMKMRKYISGVGHVQIAGVPERHEPDIGEMNYPYLMNLLDELGYEGWVGCEYRPKLGGQPGGTSAGLGWMRG